MAELKLFPPEFTDPVRERAFRGESGDQTLPLVRMALIGAIVIYGLFGFVDPLVHNGYLREMWLIRYGIGLPLLGLTLAATWLPLFRRWNQTILTVMALLVSATLVASITLSEGHVYYASLIFAILFIFIFLRVRYLVATSIGLALVVSYIAISQTALPIDRFHFLAHAALLAGGLLVAMLVAYFYERSLRREYLQQLHILDQQHELYRQAYYDDLTGLPNRNGMLEALRRRVRAEETTALLILNVESFASINNTLGYDGGDQLLAEIARRLRLTVAHHDEVAHLRGAEFCVLANVDGHDEAATLADRLLHEIQRPYTLRNGSLVIGIHIGISLVDKSESDAKLPVQRAELALHEAETSDHDKIVFYGAEQGARAMRHLELRDKLQWAFGQNEFRLHYQPLVELRTGEWIGAEALLRWERPGHGLLAPAEFMDALESSDLMIPVGDWILDRAAADSRYWRDRGLELPVAVNLSARQCSGSDVYRTVLEALDRHNLPPSSLILELTETVALSHHERVTEMIANLKELGVRVALDDFGTGHSSLSHLYRLAVSVIKIDRSFVAGLGGHRGQEEFVEAILTLASKLGKDVIAEGIETGAQLEFLVAHDCPVGQGFYFARPMPAEDIERMYFEHWRQPEESG